MFNITLQCSNISIPSSDNVPTLYKIADHLRIYVLPLRDVFILDCLNILWSMFFIRPVIVTNNRIQNLINSFKFIIYIFWQFRSKTTVHKMHENSFSLKHLRHQLHRMTHRFSMDVARTECWNCWEGEDELDTIEFY